MEGTTQRRRLRMMAPWLIAALAVAGAGVLLMVDHCPRRAPSLEIPRQDGGGAAGGAELARQVAQLQHAPDNRELYEKIVKLAGPGRHRPGDSRGGPGSLRAGTSCSRRRKRSTTWARPWTSTRRPCGLPRGGRRRTSLGLALEMAQRQTRRSPPCDLYLAAEPEGRKAGAIQDEIRKIEVKRNKSFSMPLGIATRCQFKVPDLVANYWLYLDGRLSQHPATRGSHPHVQHDRAGAGAGIQFWDKEGWPPWSIAAEKSATCGKGTDIYAAQTFDVEPGAHALEFLLLNKTGFPFAIAAAKLELKYGDAKGFWFNMPADYAGQAGPLAVMPFWSVPDYRLAAGIQRSAGDCQEEDQGVHRQPGGAGAERGEPRREGCRRRSIRPFGSSCPRSRAAVASWTPGCWRPWCSTLPTSIASTKMSRRGRPTTVRPTSRIRWPGCCRWSAPHNRRIESLKEIADGLTQVSPFRTAHTAAWVRSVTPIFSRIC